MNPDSYLKYALPSWLALVPFQRPKGRIVVLSTVWSHHAKQSGYHPVAKGLGMESYNVLFEGRYVGRPREVPWFWGLEFHEWQGSDGPQYGNAANREAAMKAFRAAWDRRPKARGKSPCVAENNN